MPTSTRTDIVDQLLDGALCNGLKALSEYDSKRVLAAYGVPVTPEELAKDKAEAVSAAENLGFPVAVKACSPELLHKSDQGLVRLGLDTAQAVESAVDGIAKATEGTSLDGFLVQAMVKGRREVIIGGMRDPSFGPSVMLGLGGILVEAVADVSFRLVPLEERDAREMIAELRAQKIFEEFRGEAAVDRSVLADTLIAVGRILEDCPEVSQVDINPLIFDGSKPVAVDGLITLATA